MRNLSKISIELAIALTFLGFYIFLLILNNIGLLELSRQFSIPFRMVISLLFIISFISNPNKLSPNFLRVYFIFIIVVFFRIFIDYYHNRFYYLDYLDALLFLISFSIIPFFSISTFSFSKINYKRLFNYFLALSFLFSVVAAVTFSKYIGQVGRLNSTSTGEDVISPLILSYCSTLCISICIVYFLSNNRSKFKSFIAIVTILLSTIPFFLGASRGALVAMLLSFFGYLVVRQGIKSIFYGVFVLIIFGGLIYYFDQVLGSGLLDRFFSTAEGIEQGNESANRLVIWKSSFDQFINHPFFGDRLQMTYSHHYPHNLIIESLQAFGLIGSIPLFILIAMSLKKTIVVFKGNPEVIWIPILFVQSLIQYMFSGTFFSGAWLWCSIALLLSISIKSERK